MKQLTILGFCLFLFITARSQSYIQVNGEPGLSVFLDNQYKGKTTAEYKGYIIENVSAGKHLIKIEKAGYAPYEESIIIKSGEVFSYNVKPFSKHVVQVSEKGSSGQTEKQAAIETGKLIIQSVPIEIRITMPDIDGINNTPKSKDEWQADKIPTGMYDITFTYNQKQISKRVEITGNETTKVFVNMLSGEFRTENSRDARLLKEKIAKAKNAVITGFVDSMYRIYQFRIRIKEDEFRSLNKEAASMMIGKNWRDMDHGHQYAGESKGADRFMIVSFDKKNELIGFNITVESGKYNHSAISDKLNKLLADVERSIPKEHIRKYNQGFTLYFPQKNLEISVSMSTTEKSAWINMHFMALDR